MPANGRRDLIRCLKVKGKVVPLYTMEYQTEARDKPHTLATLPVKKTPRYLLNRNDVYTCN
jgi:hypothetical protein